MHIEINAKSLAAAATAAARVAGRKSAMALVYHHVLLEADSAGLTMTAVDDRLSLRRRVGVEHVHRPGEVCLPADSLSALASKIPPAAVVSLEHAEGATFVMLSFGRARHSIPCLPSEEFPPLPSEKYETEARADAQDLFGALSSVSPFADRGGFQWRLSGVNVRLGDSGLEFLASDGQRLSRARVPADGEMTTVTVPVDSIPVISGILSGCDGDVIVKASKTKIRFDADNVEIVSRVLDDEYPNIDAVEQSMSFSSSCRIDAVEMKAALERLKILAQTDSVNKRSRYIHLRAKGNVLYAFTSETCVEEIPISDASGAGRMTIHDDALSLLLATVSEEALLEFDADTAGCVLRVKRPDHPEVGHALSLGIRVMQPKLAELD